jgi:hypothetical protein
MPPAFRRVPRVDLSLVVLGLMLVFCIGGIVDLMRSYPQADRGMLVFARAQKDMFVDDGLVSEAYHVRANADLARVLRSETVIVGTRTSDHTGYVGAGVILGERDGMLAVITAKHIVTHPGRHFVVFRDFTGRFTSRIVTDPKRDLAIVFVHPHGGLTYRTARIAPVSFRSGQRFIVMGHPGYRSWFASPGVAEHHMQTTLLFCPTCDRGDSGAGAFDTSGNLRGIVVTKAVMIAPSAKSGTDFRVTAFEIERPDAVRALLRRALE